MSDQSTPNKPRILASEIDSHEYIEGELVSKDAATETQSNGDTSGDPSGDPSVDKEVAADASMQQEAGRSTESTAPEQDAQSHHSAASQAVLALGGGADAGGIEIAGLHEDQVSVLQEQHAKGLIEVQRKASELKVDIQALDQTLESLTGQARTANDAGVNITATHTQNTSLGQTEIIVGNTQRAAAGKVAPLWAGLENSQLRIGLMIGAAVLGGILLSALFG